MLKFKRLTMDSGPLALPRVQNDDLPDHSRSARRSFPALNDFHPIAFSGITLSSSGRIDALSSSVASSASTAELK
jgi:hypothetical protein